MKFPLHSHTWHDTSIREDDGTPVAQCATTSIRDELVRRANAFDELLTLLKEYEAYAGQWAPDYIAARTRAALTKYGDKT